MASCKYKDYLWLYHKSLFYFSQVINYNKSGIDFIKYKVSQAEIGK